MTKRLLILFACAILTPLFSFTQVIDGKLLVQQRLKADPGQKADDLSIQSITVTRDYVDPTTNIRHIYASQRLHGLEITEAAYSLHIGGNGVKDASNLVPLAQYRVQSPGQNISSSDAVQAVFNDIGYAASRQLELKQPASGTDQYTIYRRNENRLWDIPCRLVYYTNHKSKTLIRAWEVQLMDVYKKHYWQAYVDAGTGKVLSRKDLILHCDFGNGGISDKNAHRDHHHSLQVRDVTADPKRLSGIPNTYRVIDAPFENPIEGTHSLATTGGEALASPDGWHKVGNSVTYEYTRGNNVWSFYDPSPGPLGGAPVPANSAFANGADEPGGVDLLEPFLFDYTLDLNDEPVDYRPAAIVNLFYWNNLIHDVFYQFGFDEDGGNFQSSHVFSTGTRGAVTSESNDEVWAQAQDGGGTNNANFLTLPDGINGQMQMYLWTPTVPDDIVLINTSSSGIPANGTRYNALQGAFAGPVQPDLYTNPVMNKQLVIVERNAMSTVGTSSQGCTSGQQSIALPPSNDVTDKIVLIDRGSCSFVEKVYGAQLGGAAGVIIINNIPGPPLVMGGSDAPGVLITIPAVMVSQADGQFLKTQITGGATITASLQRTVPVPPMRDGDFDNGVIAHEYGHGISSRLTGGPDGGSLGGDEQGGEGWSDFIGLYMTLRTNDLDAATAEHPNGVLPTRSIGNYVTYQAINGPGIRPAPYSIDLNVNGYTYGNINDGGEITIPHGVGSIWCTMLYEMLQEFIDLYGFNDDIYNSAAPVSGNVPAGAGGNNVAMRLIIEGMKLQPNSPTFVQMREGILDADTLLYNGQHGCRIWRAFAKRGLGYLSTAGSNQVNDEFESFDVPLSCDPDQKRVRITKSAPVIILNGNNITYSISVTNRYNTALTAVSLRDTLPANLSFVSSTPAPTTTNGQALEWVFDLAGNEMKNFSLTVSVNTPGASDQILNDDHEDGAGGWTSSFNAPYALGQWAHTTNAANAFSGTKYWFSENIGEGGQDATLAMSASTTVPAGAHLIFIHKYATESTFDGGFVEVSTDDGVTWTYLPPTKFVSGGYNTIIPTLNTPQVGAADLAAFSGASPGYITSIASLEDYAGQSIRVRFRMVADAPGTSVDGWYIDDVLILSNVVSRTNTAYAKTTDGEPYRLLEGTNARAAIQSFVIASAALPAGLGPLTATVTNGQVKLKWSNGNDESALRYIIERKLWSETSFTELSRVEARQASGDQEYIHNDVNLPAGQYHYRVKMEKLNGQVQYTNIAYVRLGDTDFKVLIYPNPSSDATNISISNPAGGAVTYRVFDVRGNLLGNFNAGTGTNLSVTLPLQSFAEGTYWIEVRSGERVTTVKMVVQR